MGDFNFNLLNSNDKLTENFVDMMFDKGYYPLINKPTRITTKSSKTIITFGPMQNVVSKF